MSNKRRMRSPSPLKDIFQSGNEAINKGFYTTACRIFAILFDRFENKEIELLFFYCVSNELNHNNIDYKHWGDVLIMRSDDYSLWIPACLLESSVLQVIIRDDLATRLDSFPREITRHDKINFIDRHLHSSTSLISSEIERELGIEEEINYCAEAWVTTVR